MKILKQIIMKNILLIGMIYLISSMSVFCQSKKTWAETQSLNSITTYRDFIKKYPDGKYTEEAKLKLSQLEFAEAKKWNTISRYEDFIKNAQDKQLIPEAQMQISKIQEEQKAFERAKTSLSADTIVAFLKKYPNSDFKKKAETLLEEIRYNSALFIGTDSVLLAYIKESNNITHCRKAAEMLKGYEVISPLQVIPWSSLPSVFCSGQTSTDFYTFGVDMRAFSIEPREDLYSGTMYAGGWRRYYKPNSVNLIFETLTAFDGYLARGKAAATEQGLLFDEKSLVMKVWESK
jgi:outer membrane protein assembly factor BamD (BamD/ComL family)